ncbi:MAG: SET domain-containing protein [Deltaproteobacteria bacterium]|nr:SET domain-containing protein [Deltaproteobacteria bacterium]
MLTIATYLDRSGLHGIGVFAGRDIAGGQVIWEFNPLLDLEFTGEQWRRMQEKASPHSFRHIRRYSYKEDNKFYLCLDNAQFMNHSSDHHNVANNKNNNTMVAKGDIRKGEELLCNYFEYCDSDDFNLLKLRG